MTIRNKWKRLYLQFLMMAVLVDNKLNCKGEKVLEETISNQPESGLKPEEIGPDNTYAFCMKDEGIKNGLYNASGKKIIDIKEEYP